MGHLILLRCSVHVGWLDGWMDLMYPDADNPCACAVECGPGVRDHNCHCKRFTQRMHVVGFVGGHLDIMTLELEL